MSTIKVSKRNWIACRNGIKRSYSSIL